MNTVRWDPTQELSLPSDVERLFGRLLGSTATASAAPAWTPPMDLAEEGSHFLVTMDLPGLSTEDVTIEVHDRTLRISGERRQERGDEHASYFRVERGYGAFARTFTIPKGTDTDAIAASFDRGVLTLRIPKPAQVKPRRIEIGEVPLREVEGSSEERGVGAATEERATATA
ncbi:MAG: Hsp20/alpha crystallin family protein [Thermoleophilia bacterium]|nr:Hsp20/alpha crystallin family protein [Thermoleophilia bacterium]